MLASTEGPGRHSLPRRAKFILHATRHPIRQLGARVIAWIVVYCEKLKEPVAAEALAAAGFPTVFLHIRKRRWRQGRRVWEIGPLWPRYLFAECMNGIRPVLDCRGVAGVIGGFQPIAVPLEVIMELRSRADDNGLVTAPPLRIGDVYKLGRLSPLAGLLAEIASLPDPSGRLTAFVRMFGASHLITIRTEDLEEM